MEEKFSLRLSLRLYRGGKAFGPGIAELLRGVEGTGSLQKAAGAMGMAYSKAWKIIKETEKLLGFPLTLRTIGGENGGGSRLTPQGRLFLDRYEAFAEDAGDKAENIFHEHFSEAFFAELDEIKIKSTGEGL